MTFVGLALPQLGDIADIEVIEEFSRSAQRLGFDSLWAQEHFLFASGDGSKYPERSGGAQRSVYETVYSPIELLSAVTAWAPGMGIGTSILVAGYHQPAPLANRLATLDHLSGGRLIAGFGLGWSDEEHRAAGTNPRTRGERMDDFAMALRACWGEDPVSHSGPFFDVPEGIMRPKPVRSIPLMSGMWSEAGLRRTARHFDLWNPGGPSTSLDEAEASLARMNEWRPDGMDPLGMVYRIATETTAGVKLGVKGVKDVVADVRERGIEGVIIDTNFDTSITSRGEWLDLLERLAPTTEPTTG
ncbi:TIGR03619 family F420-dependent LLM class oxidoreductase [Nocardioides sp. NPDC051685]|uniref:TIGR03619 family F420-dependent LLM class oxidoreductase n=1 Tax=Nocardioides sp. NPDC051685 TaxID=3364334 RepID=UPI0037AAECA6